MKLTREDREYLREHFHEEEWAINQIEEAIKKTTFKIGGKRVTSTEVIRRIGREHFLSCMDRSAFHWSATTETPDGERVDFDSRRFFRT